MEACKRLRGYDSQSRRPYARHIRHTNLFEQPNRIKISCFQRVKHKIFTWCRKSPGSSPPCGKRQTSFPLSSARNNRYKLRFPFRSKLLTSFTSSAWCLRDATPSPSPSCWANCSTAALSAKAFSESIPSCFTKSGPNARISRRFSSMLNLVSSNEPCLK